MTPPFYLRLSLITISLLICIWLALIDSFSVFNAVLSAASMRMLLTPEIASCPV